MDRQDYMLLLALYELKEATAQAILKKAGSTVQQIEHCFDRLVRKKYLTRRVETNETIYLLHPRIRAKMDNGDDIYEV